MTHILILDSRFYEDIADQMVQGAEEELKKHEGVTFERVSVPGAFELPQAIAFAHKSGKYHGYVILGCIIRGETSHYDVVCTENARGINLLAAEHGLALGYGVLTCENREQAEVRADVNGINKGGMVTRVALEMLKVKRYFSVR